MRPIIFAEFPEQIDDIFKFLQSNFISIVKLGKQNLNGSSSIQSSFDLFDWKNLPIFSGKKGWCFGAFVA